MDVALPWNRSSVNKAHTRGPGLNELQAPRLIPFSSLRQMLDTELKEERLILAHSLQSFESVAGWLQGRVRAEEKQPKVKQAGRRRWAAAAAAAPCFSLSPSSPSKLRAY